MSEHYCQYAIDISGPFESGFYIGHYAKFYEGKCCGAPAHFRSDERDTDASRWLCAEHYDLFHKNIVLRLQ
jgi:hypothetical protein